jgi:hypothetical protein
MLLPILCRAQFAVNVTEKNINEAVKVKPKEVFRIDDVYCNKYNILEGSLYYCFVNGLSFLSVFYPLDDAVDRKIMDLTNKYFIKVNHNTWIYKKMKCERVFYFESNKYKYTCQQQEF